VDTTTATATRTPINSSICWDTNKVINRHTATSAITGNDAKGELL
jgi:hypothetical protein